MSCKHCGKRLRSKFQESRGKCATCEQIESLYRDACALFDAGDHQGVVALIRANVRKLKIKIDETEMHKTPTTEAAQLGLRMLADRVGKIPPCVRSMGVSCAAHGRGAPADQRCDAREENETVTLPDPPRIAVEATRYCCPKCGSDDIDAEAWVSINDERVGNFSDGGDNFCNGCGTHFKGWCEVDTSTGACVICYFGDDGHPAGDDEFRPLANMSKPLTEAEAVEGAMRLLVEARELLVAAGTPKAAQRVRLALSSVKGALSNARHRQQRPERKRIRRAPAMSVQTRSKS